jgi:hypothetical protein
MEGRLEEARENRRGRCDGCARGCGETMGGSGWRKQERENGGRLEGSERE